MRAPSSFALAVSLFLVLAFTSVFAVLLYIGSVEQQNRENVIEHRHANQRDHNALLQQCGS